MLMFLKRLYSLPAGKVLYILPHKRAFHYFQKVIINQNKANFNLHLSYSTQEHNYFSRVQTDLFDFWKTLSNSLPVAILQNVLIEIHEITGFSWWSSIVFSTFLFRFFIILPLSVYQTKVMAKLENIKPEMNIIANKLKHEIYIAKKKFNWSESHARLAYKLSLNTQWSKIVAQHNCHPAKSLIVLWAQIPLWIFQSIALKNLVHMMPNPESLKAHIIVAELMVEGISWIPNLVEVDYSYIFPVILGVINLSIVEVNSIIQNQRSTAVNKYKTNLSRVLSIIMIPIGCTVPSAILMYWVASSFSGFLQNLVLMSPIIRRALGIPFTENEQKHPYIFICTELKKRFKRN